MILLKRDPSDTFSVSFCLLEEKKFKKKRNKRKEEKK